MSFFIAGTAGGTARRHLYVDSLGSLFRNFFIFDACLPYLVVVAETITADTIAGHVHHHHYHNRPPDDIDTADLRVAGERTNESPRAATT